MFTITYNFTVFSFHHLLIFIEKDCLLKSFLSKSTEAEMILKIMIRYNDVELKFKNILLLNGMNI